MIQHTCFDPLFWMKSHHIYQAWISGPLSMDYLTSHFAKNKLASGSFQACMHMLNPKGLSSI